MAGELERRRPAKGDLDAEGARLGASFGLGGPPQGAYRARRRSAQWGRGTSVLATGGVLAFVIPEWQHRWASGWEAGAGLIAVAGVLMMALAPRPKWDRLYWYPGGVAQRLPAEPEPKILRWADAAAVRIAYYTDDESLTLDKCIVDGPGRTYVEADRRYRAGLQAFAREAEQVIEYRLLPWPEIRVVKAHGPGRGLYVHPKPWGRGKHWVGLEMVPNGLLAHRLIEQVAAPYRVPVTLTRE